jgi:hypothetical protein
MVLRPRRRIYQGFVLGIQVIFVVGGTFLAFNRRYFQNQETGEVDKEVPHYNIFGLWQSLVVQNAVVTAK